MTPKSTPIRFVAAMLVTLMLAPASSGQLIQAFEVIANAAGPVEDSRGFVVTSPTTAFSYSADWFRDASNYATNLDLVYPQRPGYPSGGMTVGGGIYFISAIGTATMGNEHEWLENRIFRSNPDPAHIYGNSYEIRFTAGGGNAYFAFDSGAVTPVPFEVWYLANTPDDPADDIRMIPAVLDWDFSDTFSFDSANAAYTSFGWYASSAIYIYMPLDDTPGDVGYQAWVAGTDPYAVGQEHLARITLHSFEDRQGMPETGTIFRITGAEKPITLASICAQLAGDAIQNSMKGNSGKSLLSKCDSIQKALDKGSVSAALGVLGALIKELNAHSGKALDAALVAGLISDLQTLAGNIEETGAGKTGRSDDAILALEAPSTSRLLDNYPNPFNPSTTISFELESQQEIRLEVYDLLGKRLALLADGVYSSGAHEARFDASGLTSGIYLYRLTTPARVQTKSMFLLK